MAINADGSQVFTVIFLTVSSIDLLVFCRFFFSIFFLLFVQNL